MKSAFIDQTFTASEEKCQQFANIFLRFIDQDAPLRILEIGCGTGCQLLHLAELLPNAVLTGIDISAKNIRKASQQVSKPVGTRLSFIVGDYLTLPLHEKFDVILSDSTLHLIEVDINMLFTKIKQDLRISGFLICTIPSDCIFNRLLWMVRRIFLIFRGPLIDAFIFRLAKRIHKNLDDRFLKERICYMYLLPNFSDDKRFHCLLTDVFKFSQVIRQDLPHASIGQPMHRLLVYINNDL